jgi:hypothetical protein
LSIIFIVKARILGEIRNHTITARDFATFLSLAEGKKTDKN